MFEGLKGLKGFKGLTGFKGSRIKLVESALQQRYNGFHCQPQKKGHVVVNLRWINFRIPATSSIFIQAKAFLYLQSLQRIEDASVIF